MKKVNEVLGDIINLSSLRYCETFKSVLSVTLDGSVKVSLIEQPLYDDARYFLKLNWMDLLDREFLNLWNDLEASVELDYYFNKFEK